MYYKKISSKRKLSALAVTVSLIFALISAIFISCDNSAFKDFDTDRDFIKVLDVGQGDCTLIYSNGYTALIDTGTEDSAADICVDLQSCGIEKIDVLLLTHLHSDHTGGVKRIAEFFEIESAVLPEISIESEGLTDAEFLISLVTDSGGGVYTAKQGMNFRIGEFEITVLAEYSDMKDENNRSVISVAEMDGLKFMFTGDAEAKAEELLLKEGLDLKCDFFKAGHHGSSTSNIPKLIEKMKPRYTAISCGMGNMYGHPHKEVLADFEYYGTKIYRTDYDGDITFNIKNGNISVETEK